MPAPKDVRLGAVECDASKIGESGAEIEAAILRKFSYIAEEVWGDVDEGWRIYTDTIANARATPRGDPTTATDDAAADAAPHDRSEPTS